MYIFYSKLPSPRFPAPPEPAREPRRRVRPARPYLLVASQQLSRLPPAQAQARQRTREPGAGVRCAPPEANQFEESPGNCERLTQSRNRQDPFHGAFGPSLFNKQNAPGKWGAVEALFQICWGFGARIAGFPPAREASQAGRAPQREREGWSSQIHSITFQFRETIRHDEQRPQLG